ncbi:MAG: amidohydrolase family protein, partial [Lachnospiraceae bacterium]|nr:amidohydrolase family protein [Lachnospiraceae bacterium]
AVKCTTVNPAKSVGIYDVCGSITPGKRANVVLLKKENLDLKQVVLEGRLL